MNNPIKEVRKGLVKAAIFEKSIQGKNGEFKSRSVALQVGYKDKQEVIQNKKLNLTTYEIDKVIEVLTEVKAELDSYKTKKSE